MSDTVTQWTTAHQAPLSSRISWSSLKFMPIESGMLSKHLILCCPLFLLPSIFPSIRISSKELAFQIRWPKYNHFLSSIISSPLSIKQTSVATGNKKYRLYRINPGNVTKQIVIITKTQQTWWGGNLISRIITL